MVVSVLDGNLLLVGGAAIAGESGNGFHYGARIHADFRMSMLRGRSLRCAPVASIIDTVANLAKRRGLVFQSGEIYGGTKSAWDYGPLGVELKENIKRQWWRSMVTGRDDVVGLDSAIILPREVWVASGHVEMFNDPLVECLNCHKRHRQDHMQEAYAGSRRGSTIPTRCR